MSEAIEVRFIVDGNPTPWEPETVRFPALNQVPTALKRVTELRERYPAAAIATERRGDTNRRPEPEQKFRYAIYVREGSMLVNDPSRSNGVSIAQLEKQTLFSRLFTEGERDLVRAEVLKLFPGAQLTEMKG